MSETIGLSTQLQLIIPSPLETDWATSIRNNCFQKIVEHDHTGVSGKGIKIATAAITDDAITGAKIRLDNNEYLKARNAANSANKSILKVNASDEVEFGTTVGVIDLQDDGLTISDNSDNTKKIALNASNITTGTTRTLSAPDATGIIVLNDNTATLTNKTIDADSNTITNIENADIKAAAAIAVNKLAAVTASRAVVSDGSGFISAATTTATEIGYVNGVTSAIQTQLNAKAPTASPTFSGTVTTPVTASRALVTGASNELAASATTATEIGYVSGVTSAIQTQLNAKLPTTITTTGDIIYSSSGTTASRLAIGSPGHVLTVSSGLPAWQAVTVSPTAPVSKTTNYTATTADEEILCDSTSGAFTITLYTAVGNEGRKLIITKTNTSLANPVTIDGNSSETINGALTFLLYSQNESVTIESNGTNWNIISRFIDGEWKSFTPTGSWVSNSTYTGFKRRVGDSMEYQVEIVLSGAPTSADLNINLDTNETIDTAKLTSSTAVLDIFGNVLLWDASGFRVFGIVSYNSTTSVRIRYIDDAASGALSNGVDASLPWTWASGDALYAWFKVPLVGYEG